MAELKNYVEGQQIEPSDRRVYTTIEEQAELKTYREFGTLPQLRALCDRYHELISRPTESEIRAKAIDEFAEKIRDWQKEVYQNDRYAGELDFLFKHIYEIAEQLKERE